MLLFNCGVYYRSHLLPYLIHQRVHGLVPTLLSLDHSPALRILVKRQPFFWSIWSIFTQTGLYFFKYGQYAQNLLNLITQTKFWNKMFPTCCLPQPKSPWAHPVPLRPTWQQSFSPHLGLRSNSHDIISKCNTWIKTESTNSTSAKISKRNLNNSGVVKESVLPGTSERSPVGETFAHHLDLYLDQVFNLKARDSRSWS